MGTVTTPTFAGTTGNKTFWSNYSPSTGESYHTASAKDVTNNVELSTDIEVDTVNQKVTVTYEWEPNNAYLIRVNFSYGVNSPSGTAP